MHKRYRCVAFDYDGTIMDSIDAVFSIEKKIPRMGQIKQLRTKEGLKEVLDGNYLSYIKYFGPHIVHLPQTLHDIKRALLNVKKEHLKLFPGIVAMLDQITLPKLIVTANLAQVAEKQLSMFELDTKFEAYLGFEHHKSKHKNLQTIMRRYKLRRDEILFVTDTSSDIKQAQKAGVDVVLCTWGYGNKKRSVKLRPTYIADSPQEIIDLLQVI